MSASTDQTAPPWPGSKCPRRDHWSPQHPALDMECGPRSQAWPVWSHQKSAGYCQMMSSKINPVIQSFQSKLRLFESLKTHRDRELSRSCNLVTGSFSSRRIHLVSRSFLRYLAHSGSGCGYCQPQDNVLPMLPRSLRRHQRERERGWQWQVPVRQLCDNTELSSAI